jgi:hypothetical protein
VTIALNSSFESTPSWLVSRLSNDEAEAGDGVEGAGGVAEGVVGGVAGAEGVDDCCAIAAAGRANRIRRGARHCDFISVLLTRVWSGRAVAKRHHGL